MSELHKRSINDNNFVPKEGQRDLLCSNKKSFRCPSLDYKYVTPSSETVVDKAFDFLFEEVMKLENKTNYGKKQIDSNIWPSLEFQPGK